MTLNDAFLILHAHYGTHTRAAAALGYTVRRYRGLRNEPDAVPKRAVSLIMAKASDISGGAREQLHSGGMDD